MAINYSDREVALTQKYELFSIPKPNLTISTFGSVGAGSSDWWGGVLAPNGKIYGIPYNATSVLEIDPIARTTSTFGSLSGTAKWKGGVLAANKQTLGPERIIYGIQSTSTSILKIDPIAQTATTVTISGHTSSGFEGGVLGPDGKIYCIPVGVTDVRVINPLTETASSIIGSLGIGNGNGGGVLASDGKIYFTAGIIDPITQTLISYPLVSGSKPTMGKTPVLGPNGKIYSLGGSTIEEYGPATGAAPADWLLSAYQNKF